ncbi:GtrA family protein [Burkholderia pseudomultivorans]|uniref:GtrA family protein n=1 Tax=Burkholderia pseudomultivorans TaxID=1207504 RepID=UPI003A5C83D6
MRRSAQSEPRCSTERRPCWFRCGPAKSSSRRARAPSAGACVNYLLNYHVTFRATGAHCATALRFFSVAVPGIAVNGALMWLLSHRGGWPWLPAQCMSTVIVLVTTYTANSLWAFRIRRR